MIKTYHLSDVEVLSDFELMEQLEKSREDIKNGRTRSWDEFIKEVKS